MIAILNIYTLQLIDNQLFTPPIRRITTYILDTQQFTYALSLVRLDYLYFLDYSASALIECLDWNSDDVTYGFW